MTARARALQARFVDDRGTASLEFVSAGVLLLVPVIYLVLTLSALQGAAFATEGAARNAARILSSIDDVGVADRSAREAVAFALADFGLDASSARVDISCVPASVGCRARESVITVAVSVDVALPLLPEAINAAVPTRVPVSGQASQRISTFASAP